MSGAKGPPPTLPGFTFNEAIGGGGFADVFLFTQHSTGRPVAVKVLRSEHLSEASLGQFQVEANVMAGVSAHPYIVTIHDAGVAPDGRPYIVMEHYPQDHFGIRSRGGRLGVAEVLKVAVQIACAVETAHRAQILHRDIKPANALTSAFGDPGLTDFGIAGVQAEDGITAAGGVSLGFAAPEVVLDEEATGSVASDVYSLAATIYAFLGGHSPVFVPGGDNSPSAITQRLAKGTLIPLARPDVPPSLQHLLASSLSVEPGHRPDRAVTFAQAVQDVEQGLRLPATPLVLMGASSSAPRVERTDDDEDGTRRKPRVVSADGPPPITAAPTPGQARTDLPRTPQPFDPPTAPRSDRPGSVPIGETVARRRPDPVGAGAAPAQEQAPSVHRPRWLPYAAAAAAAAIAIGAVAAASLGGGENESATSTTLVRVEAQDPVGGAAFVSPPVDVTTTIDGDGNVTVGWQPPGEADDPDVLTYRVTRTDAGFEGIVADEIEDTSVQLRDLEGEPADTCVVVQALEDDVISEASPESCTGPTG